MDHLHRGRDHPGLKHPRAKRLLGDRFWRRLPWKVGVGFDACIGGFVGGVGASGLVSLGGGVWGWVLRIRGLDSWSVQSVDLRKVVHRHHGAGRGGFRVGFKGLGFRV